MMRPTILAAALLAPVVLACGSDDSGPPGSERYPTAQVCPGKTSLRAIAGEDMAGSKLADKTLILTFDNGPSPATAAIETYLSTQSIRATFFVNGARAAESTITLDQVAADQHLLANRSNIDDDITKVPTDEMLKSITDTDALLKDRTPEAKLYFRSPYGHWNDAVSKAVQASPMNKYIGPVGWDIGNGLEPNVGSDVECWNTENPKTPEQCGDLFLKQIREKKKGIVLMHDGGGDQAKTADMLKYMIPILKGEGFKFARMDEVKLLPRSQTFEGDDGPGPGDQGPGGGGGGGDGTGGGDEYDPCANP
ncbi:MAG: polysaccharide deacetylase family protein [Labilithrix sp.]|nr:polysaccharide deacetylase family protein [Labilithrix sp.]MCW5809601.1 polysaccharide deacetylase family protein [Labilithrix sp.]